MATARPLVVVSNRLPVSLALDGDAITATPSAGGLVTALNGLESRPLWIGWPGTAVPRDREAAVRSRLGDDGLVPVFLSAEEEVLYYRGFCNTALWPLFHYFTSVVAYSEPEWQAYVEVNERFATTVAERAPPNARVWVHDFHLMLVPALLRPLRPDLEIGCFLHIPFPSSEVYRLQPRREDLLTGLLGSDFIGFHTSDYARHFRSACVRVLGLDVDWDRIHYGSRTVGIGVHPIGIDTAGFAAVLARPRTAELYREYAQRYGQRVMLLGVERLDYTKGIGLKLAAFERLLQRDPSLVDKVAMLQILVPSRLDHREYQSLKSEIEEAIGRINGTHGRPGLTPVHYMHRSLEPEELVALYRFARACLVTPARDGMNLVAQEFVACQAEPHPTLPDCRGMLVLSEFAGAAHALGRALLVNPWHLDQVADAIVTALAMDDDERRQRLREMGLAVKAMDCNIWARRYVDALAVAAARGRAADQCQPLDAGRAEQLVREFAGARQRVLLLDYDGSLRELVSRPDDAVPTAEIRALLGDLAALPATVVHLVSGRTRDALLRWFGDLPIHLCAEHGAIWRGLGGAWQRDEGLDLGWMERVRAFLAEVTREVPGSFVEEKSCALAWHYRLADVDYGPWRARELQSQLEDELMTLPVEIVPGRKVIEVRAAGVDKGSYVARVLRGRSAQRFVLCIGDDRTDHDMYAAAGKGSWTIHVGGLTEAAAYTLDGPAQVRALLRRLVATPFGAR